MRSILDAAIDFNQSEIVLTLAMHGEHAMILREAISEIGSYELHKMDFVPEDKSYRCYGADVGQILFNKTRIGLVRNQGFRHVKPLNTCSKNDILQQLHLSEHTVSWKISRKSFSILYKKIQEESMTPANAPMFNVKGRNLLSKEGEHNCCTWAIERLNMIPGINASEYLKSGTFVYYLRLPFINNNGSKYARSIKM